MKNVKNLRITKLKKYLFDVVKQIAGIKEINADALPKDINGYSLNRMPVETGVSKWIINDGIKRDAYSFRSRRAYSYNEIDNLENIGFYEMFEKVIEEKNDKHELPEIDNIESIECLNSGTLVDVEKSTAEFDIEIQITYRRK